MLTEARTCHPMSHHTYNPATTAHRLLECADALKGRSAFVCGAVRVSYRELATGSALLAGRVQYHVNPGAPVAIVTSDAVELTTTALAAWRLGCPYLPLDPAWPSSRIEHILRESGATVVVKGVQVSQRIAAGSRPVISFDDKGTCALSTVKARPEDPAYVIYTSGSTGTPKGVIVTHANLNHFVRWYGDVFAPSGDDRATHFASLTFDASVFEIWPPLSAAISVWPLNRTIASDPKKLQKFIVENAITHSFAPTSIAEELLTIDWPAHTRLRFLLTGADTLRRFPPAGLPFQLVNNYGPTECTVLATSGVIQPAETATEPPSIGRPISGTQIYILDESLRPVPCGAVGEIFVGGDGVGVGYVGQPDLTAERFLEDPFQPGKRMYRTGDRGKFLVDGEIGFCGRLDSQIKIRGYRIEPDEIVHHLRAHQKVNVCAVKSIGSGASAQIAVYLELKSPATADEMREFLADRLPAYMIPDFFVEVERLALSDRGKVDLGRLPMPDVANVLPNRSSEHDSARGEIETELAATVARLLKRSSINQTDSFFQLGGHSLLAAQIIMCVRQSFDIDLPLRTVFERPTVRALAAVIEEKILASLSAVTGEVPAGRPL